MATEEKIFYSHGSMNKNLGKQLWQRALKTIPGGNGLLSKRPERYLSGNWPTYYSYCKGVNVIDLDGKKFIDMAQICRKTLLS